MNKTVLVLLYMQPGKPNWSTPPSIQSLFLAILLCLWDVQNVWPLSPPLEQWVFLNIAQTYLWMNETKDHKEGTLPVSCLLGQLAIMSGVKLNRTKLHPPPPTTTATTPLVSPTATETHHHSHQIIPSSPALQHCILTRGIMHQSVW